MATRETVATEAFTYSDGNIETVSGGNWTQLNSAVSRVDISTNRFTASHVGAAAARWTGAGTWTADQWAECVLTGLTASGQCGVIARASADEDAARDYYYTRLDDTANTLAIFKVVNGTVTSLTSETQSPANGDVIAIECEGNAIRSYINDVEELNTTDSDIAGSSATTAGVHITGSGGIFGDTWEAGNLVAAGATRKLQQTSHPLVWR